MQTLSRETSPTEALPAGGDDPQRFDVKEAWYPVFYVQDLDKTKPAKFTLLNQDIVIWWEAKSQSWRAFEDKCPHRLAPLSQGRINEEGQLECPYHGWAFSGEGECEKIPQQPEGMTAENSPRACAKGLPIAIAQDMLFVYPGQKERANHVPIPIIDAIAEDKEDWVYIDTFRDIPYDALTLLENVIDSSHIPYTHHDSVGNRETVSPVNLKVVESGKQGFNGIWPEGPRKGTLGQQNTYFTAPNLMWHDLTAKKLGRTLTVVYATPIRKGECRLFARFPFKFSSKLPRLVFKLTPRWYSHVNQNAILEDDQIFLHYQERYLEAAGGSENYAKACYLPTTADRYVSQLRQWVNRYEADPFPDTTLPPAIPTEQLLDRYHSHTKNCASCRGAFNNIRRIRRGAAFAGFGAWGIAPILTLWLGNMATEAIAVSSIASIVFGAVWLFLGRFERKFSEGRTIPPRNLS